jgi:hypothetical protein
MGSSGNASHMFFFCSYAKEGIFCGDVKPFNPNKRVKVRMQLMQNRIS